MAAPKRRMNNDLPVGREYIEDSSATSITSKREEKATLQVAMALGKIKSAKIAICHAGILNYNMKTNEIIKYLRN